MDDWRTTKLKDVCKQVTVGFVGTMADEYCDDGIPFLRSLNIKPFGLNLRELKFIPQAFHEKIKKSTLRPGDVGNRSDGLSRHGLCHPNFTAGVKLQ